MAGALTEALAKAVHFDTLYPDDPTIRDLQRVALCMEMRQGRQALMNFLVDAFKPHKQPSPALRMLAELPFKIIVTTNYDHLIDRALSVAGKDPQRIVYSPERNSPTRDVAGDPSDKEPLLFKMHGDLSDLPSIVITDEDYITFVQRMSDQEKLHPVPETVRYRMKQWPTLFIGYSLKDYNLRLLFRTLRWHVDQADIPRAFSVDRHPDPLILQVYQDTRQFITFISQDLWAFVPELYETVAGHAWQAPPPSVTPQDSAYVP